MFVERRNSLNFQHSQSFSPGTQCVCPGTPHSEEAGTALRLGVRGGVGRWSQPLEAMTRQSAQCCDRKPRGLRSPQEDLTQARGMGGGGGWAEMASQGRGLGEG